MSTELAWAAGFFEGEGNIYLRPLRGELHTPGDIRVAVTQHGDGAPALLQRFVDAVGVGHVLGPYDYRGKYEGSRTKTVRYAVQLYGKKAERAMEKLLPYMRGPKSDEWRELGSLIGTGEGFRRNTPSTSKYPA